MSGVEGDGSDVSVGMPRMRGSVAKDPPQAAVPKQAAGAALQPTPTKSSGLKTEEKRKALEVAIHSGHDIDKLMQLDGQGDQPRRG